MMRGGGGLPPTQQQQQEIIQQQRQERLARIQQHRQRLLEELLSRKAEYVSGYDLPLNYPARVESSDEGAGASVGESADSGGGSTRSRLRTSSDFINARLLEAGLPLGATSSTSGATSTLEQHSLSAGRFIRDLEGTGCYESVKIELAPSTVDGTDVEGENQEQRQQNTPLDYDVTVQLKEKNWYKLYIGGGVNSDDLSSLGTSNTSSGNFGSFGGGGAAASALAVLPKLQFETSASLLNLTGFADVTSASYYVDQTGSTSFRFVHDRPLVSYLPKENGFYQWLMPEDPRTFVNDSESEGGDSNTSSSPTESQIYTMDDAQYALGGGSHTVLGMHATFHDADYESTRSSKEFVRSVGVRLANHSRGAHRSGIEMAGGGGGRGGYKPSVSPPESMAGPYLFMDWNASLRDVLPKRSPTHPFALDCSPEVAKQAGTFLKHSLTAGLHLNGCFVDDRYDPTMGYDAHVVGEVAGPPGDVGYWKMKGGYAWHFPVELLRMMVLGVNDDDDGAGYIEKEGKESPSVIGMSLHSSFNCGVVRPLTFNGLIGNGNTTTVPSSDKFYVGGPGQLRGFLPAGIGPRSSRGGSSVPGGDALGGDLFYTSTLATSIPFPSYFSTLRQNGARLFGFANAGTSVSTAGLSGGSGGGGLLGVGCVPVWNRILQSTRVAVGGGVSVGSPMGRFEATYAVPVRYGPRDARKSVQFGFGFSFG